MQPTDVKTSPISVGNRRPATRLVRFVARLSRRGCPLVYNRAVGTDAWQQAIGPAVRCGKTKPTIHPRGPCHAR